MGKFKLNLLIATFVLLTSHKVFSLEVDREVMPRFTIFGRAISTVDGVHLNSNPVKQGEINIEDSTLITRFDKRIYSENGVAGAVVGFKEEDGSLLFHQIHVFYWNELFEAKLGRTNLPNNIIQFPTMRDEDLLPYSHLGNNASNNEFDQQYGKVFSASWIFDRKIQKLNFWTGMLRNGAAFVTAPTGFDYYGLGYYYQQPESLHLVNRIRQLGLAVLQQKVNFSPSAAYPTTGDHWMTAILAGAGFNLNLDPVNNWSMGLQWIYNSGAGPMTSFLLTHQINAIANQARSKSHAGVASIRYTRRPNLLTRWQAALMVAYKNYRDVSSAKQWSVVPSVVYVLGRGIDLLGQIKYTKYGNAMYAGGSDTVYQLGMTISLETVFNDQIGERDSIMDLEHGYIQ